MPCCRQHLLRLRSTSLRPVRFNSVESSNPSNPRPIMSPDPDADAPDSAHGTTRRSLLKSAGATLGTLALPPGFAEAAELAPGKAASQPFGAGFPQLDSLASGSWWLAKPPANNPPPPMDVPRDQVVAFALYTHDAGVLKMTAQLYPLKPGEPMEVRLELRRGETWQEVARVPVTMPGWSAHFRLEKWDNTKSVPYRVRHGEQAAFEGLIRRDPVEKDVIVLANMSCNSSRTTGQRPEIIDKLKAQDPDLLFFAGDQTYRHTEHTAGWIEFGLQFRDLLRDRPAICIPDDHDVGHPNLWGENGKQSLLKDNSDRAISTPWNMLTWCSASNPGTFRTRWILLRCSAASRYFSPECASEGLTLPSSKTRQWLAPDATPSCPQGNPPRRGGASLWRSAPRGGGEAGDRCLWRWSLSIYQPGAGEYYLWPVVAPCR